ncbi:MAG: hypothetical protein WCZ02_05795 [Lysobacterales bacterium]
MELPTDPQDLALWLFSELEGVGRVAGTRQWSGRLPVQFDFAEIEQHLEAVSEELKGVCNSRTRIIEFHPHLVDVYEDMTEMLGVVANRVLVPGRFVIRSLGFKYPADSASGSIPTEVSRYFDVVGLWRTFCQLADLPDPSGRHALFVAGHNERLTLHADYLPQQLSGNLELAPFAADFSPNEIHADQKRSIVRSILIETFKSRKNATLGDVLTQFEAIESEARKSYAMYMAEFSVKKVMSEVEKQNLDDMLSLNKTLSDIQNQLLALPAAILLAGATLKMEDPIRNNAVLAGVLVFSLLMWTLIGNQHHSINAIATHIGLRKKKIEAMPAEAGGEAVKLFKPLELRVKRQRVTLRTIWVLVALVFVLCALAVLDINGHVQLADCWSWLKLLLSRSATQ